MTTTLYRGGRVSTPEHPHAQAMVVDRGRIAWLGTDDDATGHGGVDEIVDLDGALVLPAFVDAHVHLSHTGLGLRGADLRGTRHRGQALDRIAAVARTSPGRPIFAHGWEEQDWPDGRPLTSTELAVAGGSALVYASRIDGHSAVISDALAHASGAANFVGWLGDGWVDRDAKNAARAAFDSAITATQRRDDIELALRSAAAAGIAQVHECGGPLLTSADDFRDVLDLGQRADLPETIGYWAQAVTEPEQARALVELHGAAGLAGDLNMDGSIGSHTAHLKAPYADRSGHVGTAFRTIRDVTEHVVACVKAGVQSGFHVIGDAGLDTALQGYAAAARLVGLEQLRATRPRLEHVEMPGAADLELMVRLGITASVQPAFDSSWGGPDGMYAARLGERWSGLNPFSQFVQAGVPLAFGSDSPVTPFDSWGALRGAVLHRTPGQGIPVPVAFAAHTVGGYAAAGQTGGVLQVGAWATFAVWDTPDDPRVGLPEHDPPLLRLVGRGNALTIQ